MSHRLCLRASGQRSRSQSLSSVYDDNSDDGLRRARPGHLHLNSYPLRRVEDEK